MESFDKLFEDIRTMPCGAAGSSMVRQIIAENFLCLLKQASIPDMVYALSSFCGGMRGRHNNEGKSYIDQYVDNFEAVLSISVGLLNKNPQQMEIRNSYDHESEAEFASLEKLMEFTLAVYNAHLFAFSIPMHLLQNIYLDRLQESTNQYNIMQSRMEQAENRLERSSISSVTVLSIFTATVMTFVGGTNLSLSFIPKLKNDISLILAISLVLLIFFNLIITLLNVSFKLCKPATKNLYQEKYIWFINGLLSLIIVVLLFFTFLN